MDFSVLTNRPDVLHPIGDVAAKLGLSRESAALLAASQIGGPAFQLASRRDIKSVLTPATTLQALDATPFVTAHPEALVVRVRPARKDPNDPTRPYMGWLPGATWEDHETGVGRWWAIADPDYWHGKAFVATVVGHVAHVATIKTHFPGPSGGVGFRLSPPDDNTLEAFAGKRLDTQRGGTHLYLAATPGWKDQT